MGSAGVKRRHWVTTLLAVWMFADALWLLLWEMNQLVILWRFYHEPHTWPPTVPARSQGGFWLVALFFNFESLLQLFPAPHLLLVIRQTALFRMLGPVWRTSNALDSSMNIALFGLALALGYGLLRMREWARWCYTGLCLLAVLLFLPGGFGPFLIFGLIRFAILAALLVFLFRHGLAARPKSSQG